MKKDDCAPLADVRARSWPECLLPCDSAGRDDIGSTERLASNHEAGPSGHRQPGFDAEDEAMKQALAYSLSDQSPLAVGARLR